MGLKEKLRLFFDKYFFNVKWKCNACGREIFEDKYFCPECEKSLPFITGASCEHCGRKTAMPEQYCSTCKLGISSVDKGRSVFIYEKPINSLIKKFKFSDGRYLSEIFSVYLSNLYFKNLFDADFITFVPMFSKAERKRGYNQSKLLAESLSEKVNVPLFCDLEKVKDTRRQATLKRKDRILNLEGSFKIKNKSELIDKKILIVDDVTTTGSTIEALAKILKRAGAKAVYFLTVASVPPVDDQNIKNSIVKE